MTRLFRLVLSVALVSAAACSSGPTAPPTANKLTPNVEPLMDCIGGWDVQNGRAC